MARTEVFGVSAAESQWQTELRNFRGIKSLVVLEKNTADLYPYRGGGGVSFLSLAEVVREIFGVEQGGLYQTVFFSPIAGFTDPFQDAAVEQCLVAAEREAVEMRAENDRLNSFSERGARRREETERVHAALVMRALLSRVLAVPQSGGDGARPTAVVVDMASRLIASPPHAEEEESVFFMHLYEATMEAVRVDGRNRNTLVLIVNNLRDLPEWFISFNPNLRSIAIPRPDRECRQLFVDASFGLSSMPVSGGGKSATERLVDKSDGMSLRELDELRRMFVRDGSDESDLDALVDVYKYGMKENKWALMADKLYRDPEGVIRRRVKGQDRAVETVVSVLKRSALGLSGATHSSSGKPKGILFLSGPTGTGKTEIVKAVTELLFGDERSCLRFDMSEYQGDNSDQKLFGAPPGYVGYAEGGQLTNAVRANPFSVLLFDEVEKANPSIMDKFLQILEDGRMTDGQGNTVYFSETVIFFTSNIGFTEEVHDASGRHVVDHVRLIEPGEPYDRICEKVKESMKAYFKPEFLGRVGNNVVVFDYIGDSAAAEIVEQKVDVINETVRKQHGVEVLPDPDCIAHLVSKALSEEVKEKGGRGIGNLVESDYLNVLSDHLFNSRCERGAVLRAVADSAGVRFMEKG